MARRTQKFFRTLNDLIAKRFRLFAVGITILFVVLGYFSFLGPKFNEIKEVGVFDLKSSRERLELKQQILDQTSALTEKYQTLGLEDQEKLKALLPTQADLPSMFVQIEAIGLASGLKLGNVNFTDSKPAATTRVAAPVAEEDTGTGAKTTTTPAVTAPAATANADALASIRKVTVTFTVSGGQGYDHLKRFLSDIESSIRVLDVQSLAYSPSSSDKGESYSINAIAYYFVPKP